MSAHTIGAGQVRDFKDLFIDERSHFYTRRPGHAAFTHQERWLADAHIRQHLAGRWWVAVTRAEATRILSLDLDCKGGPDPAGNMLRRYDQIRSIMPEPVVFESSNSRGLHLYWLLAEEVPTGAAVSLMARVLTEQGVQVGRGTCEVRPTTGQCLRLPLGAESALLMPDTLLQYGDIGTDPSAAIDFLARTAKRHRAQRLLDRLTNGSKQLSFPPPTTPPPPLPKPPAAPAQQLSPQPGLTQREIAVLWHVTTPLQGLMRYRQLQFLFDVVLAFKTAKSDTIALPKRRLVNMAGAHSGTYQDRLDFAEAAGLLKRTNHRRSRRHPRRFKLGMQFEGPGDILALQDGLRGRDLGFLSPRMRSQANIMSHHENARGQAAGALAVPENSLRQDEGRQQGHRAGHVGTG
jgi:hypothetical protein